MLNSRINNKGALLFTLLQCFLGRMELRKGVEKGQWGRRILIVEGDHLQEYNH